MRARPRILNCRPRWYVPTNAIPSLWLRAFPDCWPGVDLQPDDVCLCLLAYARHLKNNSKYAKAKQDYRVLDPLLLSPLVARHFRASVLTQAQFSPTGLSPFLCRWMTRSCCPSTRTTSSSSRRSTRTAGSLVSAKAERACSLQNWYVRYPSPRIGHLLSHKC